MHQLRVHIRHVAFEKRERALGKHHAEAESSVGRILLKNLDAPGGIASLDQQRKQETGRAGADDVNTHSKIGVLEYWRNGVMGLNPILQHSSIPAFHHSITPIPSLSLLPVQPLDESARFNFTEQSRIDKFLWVDGADPRIGFGYLG
jgi:hypothetical protein